MHDLSHIFLLANHNFTASHQLMQILSLETGIEGELWKEASKHLKSGHKINKSAPLFKKIEGDEKKLNQMLMNVRESSSSS